MEFVWLIVGLGLGAILGFLLARNQVSKAFHLRENDLGRQVAESEASRRAAEERLVASIEESSKARSEIETFRQRSEGLNAELSRKETELLYLQEQVIRQRDEALQMQEKLTKEFETIALKVLQKNSQEFAEANRDRLGQILNPLKERIKDFESKVEKTYKIDSDERITLKTEIKSLVELNRKLSADANNLAMALKGESKTQGDWGELQLEMLLERAGLVRDIHFVTQSAHRDEQGNLKKPDFVINLPDQKHLIIDSKVSLTAYEKFFNAPEEDKAQFLKAHVESVRNHIKDLGSKNYQGLYQINAPDYVLMYLPIEPAFSLALQEDHSLFEKALDKNVVLVTSSTLLATMRTVSFIWRQDNQKRNAEEIARKSGALYDKFVGFLQDMEKIKRGLTQSSNAYDEALNKLSTGRGSLVKRAQDIRELGAKTSKNLPDAFSLDSATEDLLPDA